MKLTYNWLKDFVEIKIPPRQLADKLTMAGLEVVSLEQKAGDWVLEIEVTSNRPDWLSVVGVAREVAAITGGRWRRLQAAGLKLKAERLPPAACSLQQTSIIIADKKDCPLYTAKIIRDVKVGPSPDWLRQRLELIDCRSINNIVDITNYVLFTYGEPLHAFDLDKIVRKFSSSQVLKLEMVIRRAKGKEELVTIDGFKRDLSNEVLVIASRTNELTNQRTYELIDRPIAIAGIMGGKDTEVSAETKNILLEAAVFNPVLIRRARQSLGLVTDSSYRFERGIDFASAQFASGQAVKLIEDIAGGSTVIAKTSGGLIKRKNKLISLDIRRTNAILGANLPSVQIKTILKKLGFSLKAKTKSAFTPTPRQNRRGSEFRPSETSVGTDTEKKPRDKSGGVFTVGAPLFRQDVSQAEDLLEEISRIFGYARIPNTLPRVLPQPTQDKLRSLVSLVKDILVAQGLNEVITYSLISQDLARQQNFYCNGLLRDKQEASLIEILNPLSKEQGILRPTLIPSLVACIHYNLDQKQQDNAIFEIAKTFCWLQDAPRETLNLGIALSGERTYFFSEGVKKEAVGFLHLKGIIEILFARLGVTDYNFSSQKAAFSILLRQQKIGYLLKEGRAFVLELCLERLFPEIRLSPRFRPLAKYPGIRRDISFVVAETVPVTELLNLAKDQAGPLLESAQLVDYYKGKQIPPGCRGITISCFYRSGERTLTEGEINPLHHKACSALNAKFAAVIR